jgi:hypothetical protein
VVVIITFFRGKIGQTGYSGLNNKFWGRLRYFYDHLSDFLQPDFLIIFPVIDCHDKLGLVVCIRRKKRPQSLFQSWITNGNIEASFSSLLERLAPLSTSPAFRQYHGGRLLIW